MWQRRPGRRRIFSVCNAHAHADFGQSVCFADTDT
jgi:hypothetical protein